MTKRTIFRAAAALALILAATVGAGTAHAQTTPKVNTTYQARIPGTKVTFKGVTHFDSGRRMYTYDMSRSGDGDMGSYFISVGFPTQAAALADNGSKFLSDVQQASWESPVKETQAHRNGVWVVEWTSGGTFPMCEIEAGTSWKRLTLEIYQNSDTCRQARAELSVDFRTVSALVGRHSPAGIPSLPALEPPPPASAPATAPTATPVPQPQYLVHLSGDQNTQSDTFTANGEFTISWSASVEDTTYGDSGYFGIWLYSAAGEALDLVANTTSGGENTFTEHADCSGGCYIKVMASNMSYTLTAS